jgi:hypothetical protein
VNKIKDQELLEKLIYKYEDTLKSVYHEIKLCLNQKDVVENQIKN